MPYTPIVLFLPWLQKRRAGLGALYLELVWDGIKMGRTPDTFSVGSLSLPYPLDGN